MGFNHEWRVLFRLLCGKAYFCTFYTEGLSNRIGYFRSQQNGTLVLITYLVNTLGKTIAALMKLDGSLIVPGACKGAW